MLIWKLALCFFFCNVSFIKKKFTRSNRCFKKSNDFQSMLSEIRLLFSNVVFVNSRKIIFVKRSSSCYVVKLLCQIELKKKLKLFFEIMQCVQTYLPVGFFLAVVCLFWWMLCNMGKECQAVFPLSRFLSANRRFVGARANNFGNIVNIA